MDAACQASLSIMNSKSLLKLTSIELVRPCNHLILICRLLLLSSVQLLSYVLLFGPHGLQHARLPCPSPPPRSLLKLWELVMPSMSIELVRPSNHLILCRPLLLLPSVFPSIRVFSYESVFLHQMAKELELQLQHQSFQLILRTDFLQDGLVGSPRSYSQESSPTPQFKSINSSALSFPYIPTLTSIHDYWKNDSFD